MLYFFSLISVKNEYKNKNVEIKMIKLNVVFFWEIFLINDQE